MLYCLHAGELELANVGRCHGPDVPDGGETLTAGDNLASTGQRESRRAVLPSREGTSQFASVASMKAFSVWDKRVFQSGSLRSYTVDPASTITVNGVRVVGPDGAAAVGWIKTHSVDHCAAENYFDCCRRKGDN